MINSKKNYLIAVLVVIFLSACAPTNYNLEHLDQYDIAYQDDLSHIGKEQHFHITKETRNKIHTNMDTKPPIVQANLPANADYNVQQTFDNNKKVQINIDDIPLGKFTRLIFGQLLNYNYVMSSDVEKSKKTVTLNLTNKVSKKELLNIVKKLYESNGFYVVKEQNAFYIKKGRNKNKNSSINHIVYGRTLPSNLSDNDVVSMLIPYYYVDLNRYKAMLKMFLSQDSYKQNFSKHKVFLIKDRVSNLKRALFFINTIDVPIMKHKTTKLIRLKNIDVESFLKELKQILPASGIKVAKDINSLGIVMQPITNLNSLFVVSDKKKWIDIVEYWKTQLDVINLGNDEDQFYVYHPKNRVASDLKQLLDGLLTVHNTIDKTHNTNANVSDNAQQTKKAQELTQDIVDDATSLNTTGMNVIEDTTRNALIIYGTPKQYQMLLGLLKKLDVLPKQVLVEVTIAELTLKDSLEHGFEWYLQNSEGTSVIRTLGGLGLGGAGLTGSIINNPQTLQVYMNFFAQKNLINILSSPKLVVVDNQSASLNVGTEVPVLNSSTSTVNPGGDQTLAQSVEYRNTGILLNVTPTIHSDNSLMLKITQTVSEAQSNSVSDISSPMILTRSINTNVVLKSGQTLMLGGLIRKNRSHTVSHVPVLSDIPIVGELFKNNQTSSDKTELIVTIKPIILNTADEATLITNAFKNMLTHTN
jgi:general secretion pathway protein D